MDEYEGEKYKVRLHAFTICTCCCLFGSVLGIVAYFTYSNNMLCSVTTNEYFCKTLKNSSAPVLCQGCNTTSVNTTSVNATNATWIVNATGINATNATWIDATNTTWFINATTGNAPSGNATVIANKTAFYALSQSIIPHNDIEKSSSPDVGAALAFSIACVFVFIGCILSCGWYIKYKPNPIKNIITRASASKPIRLTKEEIEISQINPIMKSLGENHKSLLANAIKNITCATEKDKDHYFPEALELYNKGIDQLLSYMKRSNNANERFQMAKKVDMYVKRATYLQTVISNNALICCTDKTPVRPLIEKKCVCDANTLA
jgi:hypothetical protein